jgi:hypothetical protein
MPPHVSNIWSACARCVRLQVPYQISVTFSIVPAYLGLVEHHPRLHEACCRLHHKLTSVNGAPEKPIKGTRPSSSRLSIFIVMTYGTSASGPITSASTSAWVRIGFSKTGEVGQLHAHLLNRDEYVRESIAASTPSMFIGWIETSVHSSGDCKLKETDLRAHRPVSDSNARPRISHTGVTSTGCSAGLQKPVISGHGKLQDKRKLPF